MWASKAGLVDIVAACSLALVGKRTFEELVMEELKTAMNDHADVMADLVENFTAELGAGLQPAYHNFIGFFYAIDWQEPWLICLVLFHVLLVLVSLMLRKNIKFQTCLFLFALGGVYLAEQLNHFLGDNWESFANQNYFDERGVFLSVLWSGPLLLVSIIILVNTLFSLCQLIIRWKRSELRHRAILSHAKED